MLARLFAAAGLLIAATIGATAQEVAITDAWARATPGGAQTGAAYLTLVSSKPDRLTGISTPAAEQAGLHVMTMVGNVMQMRPVDGIDLPAGQAVTLKPGGYHIMMTGLARPLHPGDSFPLTLSFASGGSEQVTVAVRGLGSMGPPGLSMPHSDLPASMPKAR
jgi:copper(I)-binding protein